MTDEIRIKIKEFLTSKISGASEQFISDVMINYEKYHDSVYFRKFLGENLVSSYVFLKNETKKLHSHRLLSQFLCCISLVK